MLLIECECRHRHKTYAYVKYSARSGGPRLADQCPAIPESASDSRKPAFRKRGGVEPRSATALAIKDVELVPVSEKQFLFLVSQTPYFALKVMRVLAQRLRVTNNTLG